ncbi:glycosyltransferase family 4 protein [Ectothiorhodospira variabilis]|nr:glycosyltransferase family 4 protein [Ectothiorhodospira variabilis]
MHLVPTNAPYRPDWVGRIRGLRALFRLVPYLVQLWRMSGRVDVVHVMANSGWAWHLFAAPAIWVASFRRVPVVVNYRGGGALKFFQRAWRWVEPSMRRSTRVIVPSGFLQDIFQHFGKRVSIVPNVVDLSRFNPQVTSAAGARAGEGAVEARPHLIVTRNLEDIYDNATAIRALVFIRARYPMAHLTIAGDGPERPALEALVQELGLIPWVRFTGRLDGAELPGLYEQADIMLNPSLTDNTPNSVLEALASGVPVVSTDVGGVPYLVEHGRTAWLVPPGSPEAMAKGVLQVLDDGGLRDELTRAGLEEVKRFQWEHVRPLLYTTYEELMMP